MAKKQKTKANFEMPMRKYKKLWKQAKQSFSNYELSAISNLYFGKSKEKNEKHFPETKPFSGYKTKENLGFVMKTYQELTT